MLLDIWPSPDEEPLKVLPITQVQRELPDLRRFRLVLIDESHNLRNREGRRYRAMAEHIAANDSRVILLSATPYNKTNLDLSNQLRLFIDEQKDIGIRPEQLLRELGETEFIRRHQCPIRPRPVHGEGGHSGRRRGYRSGPRVLRLPDMKERH